MKKHNEGYALPFVLVVSIVMSLIAITVMGFAEDNLVAQKKSIQRMEAKYEATGIIEQIVSTIENAPEKQLTKQTAVEAPPFATFSGGEGLLFQYEDGVLRIASCGHESEESSLWVIAGLALDNDFSVTATEFESGKYGTLTVTYRSSAEYVWYAVADIEEAYTFVGLTPPVSEGGQTQ